jgi:hypothetical protein
LTAKRIREQTKDGYKPEQKEKTKAARQGTRLYHVIIIYCGRIFRHIDRKPGRKSRLPAGGHGIFNGSVLHYTGGNSLGGGRTYG